MKKTLLVLSALLMSFGAFAQDVTLDFTTNTWGLPEGSTNKVVESTSYTSGDYTITLAGSTGQGFYFHTDGYLMLGKKGATLTLPAFTSDVEKIEVVGRDGASANTKQNIYVGETAVSTETTGSTSTQTYAIAEDYQAAGNQYVFTVGSNHNAQITAINIYYKSATSLKAAGLTWSETSVSVEQGTEFTAPTFTKETTADVTFTSSNERVAKVSAEGVIELGDTLGTATITASSEANDEYNAGEATVTIEVFKYNVYKKATELVEGKEYLLVAQRDDATYYAYPLGETKTYGYLSTGKVDELTDEVKVKTSYNDAFTFTASGTGYTMQDYLGRYYYQNGDYKTFSVSETAPTTTWSIEAQEDGTFKFSMNDKFVQFGEGTYTSFGIYTDAQENAVLPYLYELYVEPEVVTKPESIPFDYTKQGGWYAEGETFAWDTDINWEKQALEVVVNFENSNVTNENTLSIAGTKDDLGEWSASDAAGHIHFYYTKSSNCMEVNYLTTTGGNIYRNKNYSLFSKTDDNTILISKDGVYVNGSLWEGTAEQSSYTSFDATTIEPLTALSHIWVGSTQGDGRSWATYKSIRLITATGITAVQPAAQSQSNAMYNLAGQRVSKDYKGIVVVNGKKMLRK